MSMAPGADLTYGFWVDADDVNLEDLDEDIDGIISRFLYDGEIEALRGERVNTPEGWGDWLTKVNEIKARRNPHGIGFTSAGNLSYGASGYAVGVPLGSAEWGAVHVDTERLLKILTDTPELDAQIVELAEKLGLPEAGRKPRLIVSANYG